MIRVNPINILLFVQILQRKQFEEDFNLANNISQLAWMADADGRGFGIISAGLITPALPLHERWGWKKIHHPDHLQRVVTKIKDCFQSGEAWKTAFLC
jgi:hypothetical protein